MGHQRPHFRPCHLGHLVRSWEGWGGIGAQFYLWWWSLRLLSVKVGSLSPAGFLMPFPTSVALEWSFLCQFGQWQDG